MSDNQSVSSTSKAVKHFPFGTSSEKYPASQFSHLKTEDRGFALDLATTESLANHQLYLQLNAGNKDKEKENSSKKKNIVLKAGDLKELLGTLYIESRTDMATSV